MENLLIQCDGDAAFQGPASAGMVHQEASHDLARHANELGAILPIGAVLIHQPKKSFMDQGGGLKGVAGPFVAHATTCHAA